MTKCLNPYATPPAMDARDARRTFRLCQFGMLTMALVANLAPPLFVPLRQAFGLSFEQLGRLVLLNFVLQLVIGLACSRFVDRYGAKPFAVVAGVLVAAGLGVFAGADRLFPHDPYTGLLLGTAIFSPGGGILELILSPIVNALPSNRKAADMSLLHAFYAIGQLLTVLGTTLAVRLGVPWQVVATAWMALPLAAAAGFMRARIPRIVAADVERHRLRDLIRQPVYLVVVAGIFLAGASEMAVSQWISAYAEKGLGLPKLTGDLAGCCLFACMLGAGRLWMGAHAAADWRRAMPAAAGLVLAACLVAGVAPWAGLSLGACAAAGLGLSILWPGMLVTATRHFPRGGATMFALLSASGTLGCAVSPWLVGLIADRIAAYPATPDLLARAGLTIGPEPFGLRAGLLLMAIFPALLLLILRRLRRAEVDAGTALR